MEERGFCVYVIGRTLSVEPRRRPYSRYGAQRTADCRIVCVSRVPVSSHVTLVDRHGTTVLQLAIQGGAVRVQRPE